MNFPLQKLESFIDEEALILGEELLAAGRVSEPAEMEKHLWVAQVNGYEVELQVSPSRVLAATCECRQPGPNGICEHLAAAMLLLRRRQQEKTEKRSQARREKQEAPRKLTTGVVLDNVQLEELIDFVREYARTNRNFAIALKARFASSVSEIDAKEKYLQLLESTIKAVRKPDRTLTIRGSQKLLKVLEELRQQAVQAIDKADFVEAAYIAQSIIEKITPILKKAKGKQRELHHEISRSFESLFRLLSRRPAPFLMQQLWDYALGEYDKLVYRANGVDLLFFKLLLQLAEEPSQQGQLLEALQNQQEKYRQENRPTASLLLFELSTLEKAGQAAEARQLMESNLSQPGVLQYAIQQASQRKQRPRIKALATMGLRLSLPEEEKAGLEELLLAMAEEDQERDEINRYAFRRFLGTLDFHYYFTAKEAAGKRWDEQVQEALAYLHQQVYSSKIRDSIARIYAEEGQVEQLMDYAETTRSLELLLQFGQRLIRPYPERASFLYRHLLRDYVKNHLGRKTSKRVRETLSHLYEIGAGSLAEQLVGEFRSKYPERHSLMEELASLEH